MKRSYVWLFGFLAFWLLASPVFADFKDLPADAQKNLAPIKKYPKASSIVLWAEDNYVLRSDGSKTHEVHIVRYLPDEAARDNWGDPRVPYVVGRDSLTIFTARAYTKDGRTIDCTPHNAYNPVVPDGLDRSPAFAPFRQMVVTLMGLENGCITELHYRLNTSKPLFPWLEGRVYLREESPVMARRVTVQIPDGQALKYKADRGAPEPAVSGATYTWTVGELAGYDKQDLQGHLILLPNIAFSSARDWEQVRSELHSRFAAAVRDTVALPASLSKALAGVNGVENRLNVIKGWVKERFNVITFDHPDFAFALRPAPQILESGHGNNLEMAALLCSLSKSAGLDFAPAAWSFFEPAAPYLHDTEGFLIVERGRAGEIQCDPLAPETEFSSANLNGCYVFPFTSDKATPGPARTRTRGPRIELAVSLDDLTADTLHGHGTLEASGEWGAAEAVRADGAEDYVKSVLQLKGLNVTQARIRTLESSHRTGHEVEINFDFTAAALDTADHYHVLPLSVTNFQRLTPDAPFAYTSREFRQDVPMPGELALRIDAPLPETWQVKDMPRNLTRTWDFDEGTVKTDVKGGRVVFERTLKLSKEWIPPESWNQYRTFILDAGKRPDNAIVFAPKDVKTAKK